MQLFSGPVTGPTLLTGTFSLTGESVTSNSLTAGFQLTVGQVAGAVPEPSTWAMMMLGFGLAGAALRRRKTRIAYA